MKKTFIVLFIIGMISAQVSGKQILERAWEFKSSADVTFVIKDTLAVYIHFPGAVPDDRLIGYCHFSITVSDSNPGANVKGKSFAYLIKFDSGFNAFDHILTLNINYSSGLFAKKTGNPRDYKVYMDPYPVSKIHQWFQTADSNITVNPDSRIMSVVYYHKKLQNVAGEQLRKKLIASNGYPFDYGIFLNDSSMSIHIPKHNNKADNIKNVQSYRLFSIDGRCAGIAPPIEKKKFGNSYGCFIVQVNKKEFRRIQNVRF